MTPKTLMSRIAMPILLALGTSSTIVQAADEVAGQSSQTSSAGAYLTDSAITTKVKAALISNKLTGISVKTDLGVVALSGSVATEDLRQKVTKIVASVDGVRGVDYTDLSIKLGS
jgi:hyperosmotically inducible protein